GLQLLPCADDADFSSTLLTDGRMSWPSGHTGTSCCVYVYLSCWFYLRLVPYKRLGFWKFAVPLVIVLFPLFVGITRVLDYRHHWTDVLTGGIIGSVIGYLSFRFYYKLEMPPIFSQPKICVPVGHHEHDGDKVTSPGFHDGRNSVGNTTGDTGAGESVVVPIRSAATGTPRVSKTPDTPLLNDPNAQYDAHLTQSAETHAINAGHKRINTAEDFQSPSPRRVTVANDFSDRILEDGSRLRRATEGAPPTADLTPSREALLRHDDSS
ncbi:PAP2 superfamily protein, partial [Gregarina niphandrodes]